MAKLTRRGFFKQTSAGVSTIGVLAAVPCLTLEPTAPDVPTTGLPLASLTEPLLAHIRDAATGEIALFIGSREIIYRDAEVVSRLLQAVK